MTRDDMKALIVRLHEMWGTGDIAQIAKIYAPDFAGHFAGDRHIRGHDGVRNAVALVRGAFPDWRETIEDMLIDGDRVVTRYLSEGTHQGRFVDLSPTGKPVRTEEISIYRVENGLVTEQWCLNELWTWYVREKLDAAGQRAPRLPRDDRRGDG